MPESFIYGATYQELTNPPHKVHSRAKNKDNDPRFHMHGMLTTHPECCANREGSRQTVTFHEPLPTDPLFAPLLDVFNSKDTGTNDQEIINDLKITGRLLVAVRGKELVLGVGCVLGRVSLCLEGHGFWMPTTMYMQITSSPPVPLSTESKGKAYIIPENCWSGPPGNKGRIRILISFVCENWTWVFVDHNAMLSIHIMALRRPARESDLIVGSEIWSKMWSSSHGPSLILERPDAEQCLANWRQKCIRTKNDTPIFVSVKKTQTVFNGYGAQETSDMLFQALLLPMMPTYVVCCNNTLWERFSNAVFDYQNNRSELLKKPKSETKLAYVSGYAPITFKQDAHNHFLSHVTTYRRESVKVNEKLLATIKAMGLLNPFAIMQNNGVAILPPGAEKLPMPSYLNGVRDGCKTVELPIRKLHWWSASAGLSLEWVQKDVKNMHNMTTLGPYSFRVFVDANWTVKTLESSTKEGAEVNSKAMIGRRRVNGAIRKRPLADDVAKTAPPLKKAKVEKAKVTVKKATNEKKDITMTKSQKDPDCIIM